MDSFQKPSVIGHVFSSRASSILMKIDFDEPEKMTNIVGCKFFTGKQDTFCIQSAEQSPLGFVNRLPIP
ncbi:MAG: hypothetical protein Q9P90_07625 [candidate division KSB1 bacterium]|nr:hypothetical protein [candidate division KSB1 bacterium]